MARNFQFVRGFLGKRRQQRSLSVNVRLLGAYHDGYIELRYPRVSRYALNVTDGERGHRDWRYDELRLSDRGYLVHEIEWSGLYATGVWVIETSDLEFRWCQSCDKVGNLESWTGAHAVSRRL